ncbi:MAG: DEAD/DEAH box helicase [Eubacteriaceae bacterium]|jgi:ATP-dependent RNA helicase DeaD
MKFNELNIGEDLKEALADQHFDEMTKIQERAIPVLIEGKDLIGKSQTGTGKTFAFAIPSIEKIDAELAAPQILVLLPTRELALQVAQEYKKLLHHKPEVRVVSVFGGAPMDQQIRALRRGAQIVVGTPGRVMDMIRRKVFKLGDLKMVVLDEADEMLNMGFREDIEWVLESIEHQVQIVMFSATMPKPILRIAKNYQTNPEMVEIEATQLVAPGISQKYFNIADGNKFEALSRLIDVYKPQRSLIFCNTKALVDELTSKLQREGYPVDRIHGDMPQAARLKVLKRFSDGELKILVATDVAARGIDVNDVDIVFNYDVPDNEEYYVHRIGRTGRAGKTGLALTLARMRDQQRLRKITDYTKKSIERDLIPTGEVINEIKTEHFKERFKRREARTGDMDRYLQIVDELGEKGYDARTVAAVLVQKLMPLEDGEDLNEDFRRQPKKKQGSRKQGNHYAKKGSYNNSGDGQKRGRGNSGKKNGRKFDGPKGAKNSKNSGKPGTSSKTGGKKKKKK